jgi:hypothetical protein
VFAPLFVVKGGRNLAAFWQKLKASFKGITFDV